MTRTQIILIFLAAEFVLKLLTAWKVFEKYGELGWKGMIPFYSDYIEFCKLWDSRSGIIYIASTIGACVFFSFTDLSIIIKTLFAVAVCLSFMYGLIRAYKKAMVFHKSSGFALLLYVLPFIGNLVIGLGPAVFNPNSTGSMNPLTGRDI